jgi:hypothetical protein
VAEPLLAIRARTMGARAARDPCRVAHRVGERDERPRERWRAPERRDALQLRHRSDERARGPLVLVRPASPHEHDAQAG